MKAQPVRLFLFRLARELGMTVSRLMRELDAREISEWMAFFTIEADEREKKQQKDPAVIGAELKAATGDYQGGNKSR